MNETEIEMIKHLQNLGFAVVVISPDDLGDRNPSHVEYFLWDSYFNIPDEAGNS